MAKSFTIEIMLNEHPAKTDVVREAGRWKRGQIVGIYHRKPDGRPGMPRTVFLHVDNVPNRVNVRKLRWSLLNDHDKAVLPNGDEYPKSRGAWRIRGSRAPNGFWAQLNADRWRVITWRQFRNMCESNRNNTKTLTEADLTEGPAD